MIKSGRTVKPGSKVSIISQNEAIELSELNSLLNQGGESISNSKKLKSMGVKLHHSFENILNNCNKDNEILNIKKQDFENRLEGLRILNNKTKNIREQDEKINKEPLKLRDENELRDIEKRGKYKTNYFSDFKENIHEFLFARNRQIKYCLKKLHMLYETEKGETKALEQYENSVFDQIVSL